MLDLLLVGGLLMGLYLLSTPYVATYLMYWLERGLEPVQCSSLQNVEALVVLGADFVHHGPEYGGKTVGPLSLERLRYAARLQTATGLPLMITGGPISPGDPPIAEVMARVLKDDFGAKATWIETASRNTREHARFCAPILREHGVAAVGLVTHACHMRRARKPFLARGFRVVVAPTRLTACPRGRRRDFKPGGQALAKSMAALREACALLVDGFRQ